MGVLEQITQLKNRGYPDDEIINELSQQGVSPKEINDALKQVQIKYAVSDIEETGDMQQSIIKPEEELTAPIPQTQTMYKPKSRELSNAPEQETYTPQPQEQYAPPQEFYQPDTYSEYPTSGFDADTIIEISNQVFSEKIKKIQKQADAATETTVLLQTKVDNISERLKKIEIIIDKLQIAILEKIGSYGQNLESIKKEMSMMQDSFGKIINPVFDKIREKKSLDDAFSEEKTVGQVSQKKTKKKLSS